MTKDLTSISCLSPENEENEGWAIKIFKEIMVKNVSNLANDIQTKR